MHCDVTGGAERHRPCDSNPPFVLRPNYAVLGSVLAALLFAASATAAQPTATPSGRTWESDGSAPNIQRIHNTQAVDGDTITIPSGTFSWTSTLNITKGITIQGNTTTDPINGIAVDNTIIQDNIPLSANNGLISLRGNGGQRITGITFVQGRTQMQSNGIIRQEAGHNPSRFDHLHFNHVYFSPMVQVSVANFGVIDHCVMDHPVSNEGIAHVWMNDVNRGTNGDGAFTQPADWGSANFFFIETNYLHGGADVTCGTRLVVRYNTFFDANIASHGTAMTFHDGRGPRAVELYNNEWHSTTGWAMDGCNGGTYLAHDNTFPDIKPSGISLGDYRCIYSYGAPFYGADGANAWDYNATEADGSHVDGHHSYLFESGTLTSTGSKMLTDSTKHWATNQWANYSVRRTSDAATALIASNTATTLTIQQWQSQGWAAGNNYEIHKVLSVLDQPGLGQVTTFDRAHPAWPNQQIEPCYSWNNVAADNSHVNFVVASYSPTIIRDIHYFNDTPLPGYTPYTYPHPLTTSLAPPQPRASSPQQAQKKRKKWGQAKKGWGKAKKLPANEMAQPEQ
jgi:hypothetical protein